MLSGLPFLVCVAFPLISCTKGTHCSTNTVLYVNNTRLLKTTFVVFFSDSHGISSACQHGSEH